jgi:hypothetical protein
LLDLQKKKNDFFLRHDCNCKTFFEQKKVFKAEKQHRPNAKPAIWHYLILFSTTINTFCLLSDKATNFCTSWGEKKIKNLKEKQERENPRRRKSTRK